MKEHSTLAYGSCEDILRKVAYDSVAIPEDWQEFITYAAAMPHMAGMLVIAGGGKLTPEQRVDVREIHNKHKFKIGVLTQSHVTRGVLTALGWFGIEVAAYKYDGLKSALTFLDRPHLFDELNEKLAPLIDKRVQD